MRNGLFGQSALCPQRPGGAELPGHRPAVDQNRGFRNESGHLCGGLLSNANAAIGPIEVRRRRKF